MTSYSTQNLAKTLKISGQTVRNIAKKLNIEPEKDNETSSFIFSKEQAEAIAKHLNKSLNEQTADEEKEPEDALISVLNKTIDTLQEQLKVKDKQIETLLETNKELTESNKQLTAANAVQIASDKKEILLAESSSNEPIQEKKKKGFFARLFGE